MVPCCSIDGGFTKSGARDETSQLSPEAGRRASRTALRCSAAMAAHPGRGAFLSLPPTLGAVAPGASYTALLV
ncbi:MAG: hypothetical protein ACYTDW_09280 [Planctomycetota bacterium]